MNRPPTTAAPPAVRAATPAVHLALLAVQIFFASFSPVGKIVLREVPTVGLAAIRVTLASLVFVLVWVVTGVERVGRRDLLRLAVYAFFGIIANQLLFMAGLSRTTATSAVVLGASIPVFTVGVALLAGREKATAWKLGGLGVALGGALVLTGHAGLSGASSSEGHRALVGNLLILTNCLSYSIYLVASRDILSRIRPLTAMTWVFVFGALGIDLFLAAGGALGLLDVGVPELLGALPGFSTRTWQALAYIVAFPSVGAYLLNAVALRAVPASLVATYIYVQPVVGALLSAALLGERPGAETFVAAALIFSGVGLVNWDAARTRRAAERAAPTA